MRVRLLTFRYSTTLGAFDDSALVELLRDKELISLREHFFRVNGVPHLACVVTWHEPEVPAEIRPATKSASAPRGRDNGREDPTAALSESDRALFQSFREWRTAKAREEGVPPYLILTNRQVVLLLKKRPESKTALTAIEDLGKGKVERYGDDILRLLHGEKPEKMSSVTKTETSGETPS